MTRELRRRIEWYSVLYSTGNEDPSFKSSEVIPYLEGGREVLFGTFEEAVLAVESTPMYMRAPMKAIRKFKIVRTIGDMVFSSPVRAFGAFVRNKDTHLQWFEVMVFENGRSFDAAFRTVELEDGRAAAYGSFKEAFNAMLEITSGLPDVDRERYNVVWFRADLLPAAR